MYSRTCLERPPHWPWKCGFSRQVVFGDRFNCIENIGPSARKIWSFKTGGLSWQWSLKTGSTVHQAEHAEYECSRFCHIPKCATCRWSWTSANTSCESPCAPSGSNPGVSSSHFIWSLSMGSCFTSRSSLSEPPQTLMSNGMSGSLIGIHW